MRPINVQSRPYNRGTLDTARTPAFMVRGAGRSG